MGSGSPVVARPLIHKRSWGDQDSLILRRALAFAIRTRCSRYWYCSHSCSSSAVSPDELFFSSKVLTLLCRASEGRKAMISSGEGSFARNSRTSVAPSKPDCPAAFHSRRPSSMILGSWFLNGRSRIASSCGISTCSDANMLTRFSFTRSVFWRCQEFGTPNLTNNLGFTELSPRQLHSMAVLSQRARHRRLIVPLVFLRTPPAPATRPR